MISRIKKDDTVVVISGKDKGARGKVLELDFAHDRVLVKGVNVTTRHKKPKRQGERGSIVKEEAYLAMSKVMPVCPQTDKPCRVRTKTLENGERVRISSRSGETF